MRRTRVKICGITRPEDARAADEAGCDAIGLVFWPGSKRYVSVEAAARIVGGVSPLVAAVGVFVDADIESVAWYAARCGIAAAQLCGVMPEGPWARMSRSIRLIRAVGVGAGPIAAKERVPCIDDYLLDNAKDESPGGSGDTFDWSRAEAVRSWGRLWLAGGLHAGNVGAAIGQVRPYAVDVSTGVEDEPGVKSSGKIAAFIAAVREADAAVNRRS